MPDWLILVLVILSWPALMLLYWICLHLWPRKTMSVLYDMDKVDPDHELDKRVPLRDLYGKTSKPTRQAQPPEKQSRWQDPHPTKRETDS